MSKSQWRLFRVRPDNFPTRRIAAASYLLARFMEKGLLEGILELLAEGARELEHGLMVSGDGFWAHHFDFGAKAKTATLIGRGRAREIIVNVVLPFSSGWGRASSKPRLEQRALELYRSYPRLDENEITRQMVSQLLGKDQARVVCSARRQQGLIHLYKAFCSERRCDQCPMG